ncbi:MAG: ATP-binding cassette domain-containing protein [Nakamurella sp.]
MEGSVHEGSAIDESAPLLEAVGVSVRYRVRGRHRGAARYLTALDGVNLTWREGETLALVGESGSGKSTLGRVLLGLLPPTSGQVKYGGLPITKAVERKLRRDVQLIFQDPYQSLSPRSTVGTQVSAGLEIHEIGERGVERTAIGLAALSAAGLNPPEVYWRRYPHQLSGGERQRVVIAGAMALGPRALVCDEPVSALDVSVRAQVLNVLATLRSQRGLSLLFITHDVRLARQMSDRIVVLYRGNVVEEGSTATVLADPQHDYTKRLLAAVPSVRVGSR